MARLNYHINELTTDVKNDLTKGQTGTDGTIPDATDSALGSAAGGTLLAFTTKSITSGSLFALYELDTSTANDNILVEYAVFGNADATMYIRTIKAQFNKISGDRLQMSFNIAVREKI